MINSAADCSTDRNPMAQMMKQFSQDKSLQQDWFASSSSSSSFASMRTGPQQNASFNQDGLMNEFFGQEQRIQQNQHLLNHKSGSPFELSHLQQELERVGQRPINNNNNQNWSSEFHINSPQLWELNHNENENFNLEKTFRENQVSQDWQNSNLNHSPSLNANIPPTQYSSLNNMSRYQYNNWSNGIQMHPPLHQMQSSHQYQQQQNGKGKMEQLDQHKWEEQFAVFDSQVKEDEDKTTAEETIEKKEDEFGTIKETEDDLAKKLEEAAALNPATETAEQFDSVWEDLRKQMAKDESELDDSDGWEDEFGEFGPGNGRPVYKPDLGDYEFETVNPYLLFNDENPDDSYSRAMELMDGLKREDNTISLSELALALEAAVQNNPTNSQLWMYLGNIQAQNEKEEPAIRALEKSIELEPKNYSALMYLAVSYTNESYDHAAYSTLEKWITEKYPDIVASPLPSPNSPHELHERAIDLFLKAAQKAPDVFGMDPDVQVGLGVLFYGGGELDKAIDCFQSAVNCRPDDYLLWNRLGATLANNGRSEDAVEAYQKALELCPTFVRARYNIGVSCLNIGCYKEAAEHLLTALSMHKRLNGDEGVKPSKNLWDMLRKALIMMGRRDLSEKAVPGGDINQFKSALEF
ncbi:unnamed protein product [Cunninghamella blakesleeana]